LYIFFIIIHHSQVIFCKTFLFFHINSFNYHIKHSFSVYIKLDDYWIIIERSSKKMSYGKLIENRFYKFKSFFYLFVCMCMCVNIYILWPFIFLWADVNCGRWYWPTAHLRRDLLSKCETLKLPGRQVRESAPL